MLQSGNNVQAIGCSEPLLITHRLDRCTEGLTVIAKSVEAVRHFNGLLQANTARVHKFYRTLTTKRPPMGEQRPIFQQMTTNGLPSVVRQPCNC